VAVKTQAIVEGVVTRIQTRSGEKDGKKWSMTNVLLVGDHTLADVTIGRDLKAPGYGELVVGLVEIDVYRNDDAVTLIEYIERAPEAK